MWLDLMIRLPVENGGLGGPWRVPKIKSTLELKRTVIMLDGQSLEDTKGGR